ncbi:hypothetical protein GCM10023193_08560 [Planotetraspora kaengkrachanensis]|uniref:Uncharacterized protein n=1 Tax=Planotetraspora kaengkrachanensis TaxID=575193 RepID=A0A8J3LWB9_9ACTN|nr:hypothetical protein Pka01_08250 [Planotetraspora kaengkrachanensis]
MAATLAAATVTAASLRPKRSLRIMGFLSSQWEGISCGTAGEPGDAESMEGGGPVPPDTTGGTSSCTRNAGVRAAVRRARDRGPDQSRGVRLSYA